MKYCPICERNYDDGAIVCDVDGSTLHEASHGSSNLLGKTIRGRYTVSKRLGEGGMAVVYLAEQVNVGRTVALKVLHGQYSRDPEFVKRFRQEAKLAASLSHTNVVQIYDFDQAEDGTLFIAMEYLDGRSLRTLMQQGPLGIEKVLSLGAQMAEGLGVAHHAGVIHRDIKPENIMVTGADEHIKLMDFGIARLRQEGPGTRLTRTGIIMGTPMYMAPEQIEGVEVSERTDIYALGIVLYEMLSGVAPFKAPTPAAVLMKQLKETPVPLRKLREDVPTGIQRIVAHTLEKRPERRPSSMAELAAALQKEHGKLIPFPLTQTIAMTQAMDPAATQVIEAPTLADRDRGLRKRLSQWAGRLAGRREASHAEPQTAGRASSATSVSNNIDKTSNETIAATMVADASSFTETLRTGMRSQLWIAIGAVCIASIAGIFIFKNHFLGTVTHEKTGIATLPEGVSSAPRKVVSVTIRSEKAVLNVRERARIGFTIKYEDGREADSSDEIQWSSSDPSVLEVVSSSEVEAKSPGKVELMARLGKIDAAPVAVSVIALQALPVSPALQLVSIRIQAAKNEINPSERLFLRAKGKFSDGREDELRDVRWRTNDVSVASVKPTGEILAHKGGRVAVSASYEGVTSAPFVLYVRISPPKPPLIDRNVAPPAPLVGTEDSKRAIVAKPQASQDGALREHIKLARGYRDRGEYVEALTELEKAKRIDPGNKELQETIAATRRACNAERNLGRSDLKC